MRKIRTHRIMAFGFDVSEEPRHGLKIVKHAKPSRFWLSESNAALLPANKVDA